MNCYRLKLRGDNFPLAVDGDSTLVGWYTTRWVTAHDEIDAAARALNGLRKEAPLSEIPEGCGATVFYEEIVRVEASEVPAEQGGFTFFPMETGSANKSESECTL